MARLGGLRLRLNYERKFVTRRGMRKRGWNNNARIIIIIIIIIIIFPNHKWNSLLNELN